MGRKWLGFKLRKATKWNNSVLSPAINRDSRVFRTKPKRWRSSLIRVVIVPCSRSLWSRFTWNFTVPPLHAGRRRGVTKATKFWRGHVNTAVDKKVAPEGINGERGITGVSVMKWFDVETDSKRYNIQSGAWVVWERKCSGVCDLNIFGFIMLLIYFIFQVFDCLKLNVPLFCNEYSQIMLHNCDLKLS